MKYSWKLQQSNANRIDFDTNLSDILFLPCKSHTCCQSHFAPLIVFILIFPAGTSFILASALFLLLSTRRAPACSTLTFPVVPRPSKHRCSMNPLLDSVRLTALRPRGSPAQWPSTKALRASTTSTTKFHQPGETVVENPILSKKKQKTKKTHTPMHNSVNTLMFSGLCCHPHAVLLGRRRLFLFF